MTLALLMTTAPDPTTSSRVMTLPWLATTAPALATSFRSGVVSDHGVQAVHDVVVVDAHRVHDELTVVLVYKQLQLYLKEGPKVDRQI